MYEHVIVWDLETVPDLNAVARSHGLDAHDTATARQLLGEKFPKHPWHQIVCIGALIAERSAQGWQVLQLGAPHSRPEAELIAGFVNRIAELQPQLVSFNGHSFDLPVLRYRAMAHKIAAPGLACRSYFYRYSDHAVDLCEVLSSFGNAKAKLHEISTTLGFDGKASGVDGSHVEQMVREGRISDVAAYCIEDVLNTYRIWLRYELFCGRLSQAEYEASEEPLAQRLQEHTLIRRSSASARTPHAPGNAVVAELVDALA